MSWIKKPWGEKQTIFEDNHVIVDHLKILPGGFSSVHKHQLLRNCFFAFADHSMLGRTVLDKIEKSARIPLHGLITTVLNLSVPQ